MIHLDVFSGICGFALAVEEVWPGSEHIFCEIDPFCQALIKKRFEGSVIYGDVRTLTNTKSGQPGQSSEQKRREDIGGSSCDLLTGGFPCQPFSQAGKRRGTSDNRYLWPEMLRVIREFHPTWIIAENVRGLLTIEQGVVFEQVCLDLEGEGYEVQPFIIPAVAVNAPHRRDRVWFVAHSRHGNGQRTKVRREPEGQIPCAENAAEPERPNSDAREEPISNTTSERRNIGECDRQGRQILPTEIRTNEEDKQERNRRLNRVSEGDRNV